MKEIYKDISELENQYQISDLGNALRKKREVKSSIHSSGFRIIKKRKVSFQDNGKGYKQIYVSLNKNKKVLYVHRLVAKYFIDNPENLKEVNHIDGNKSNNKASNLEWNTRQQNQQHAARNGLLRRGVSSHKSKLNEDQVKVIKRLFRMNPNFSRKDVSIKLKIADTAITKIIKGRTWKHITI